VILILKIIGQGMVLGMLLSILIGPVFFMLIKTSMQQGFRQAMNLEAGIIFSDAFCIFLAYVGLGELVNNPQFKKYFLLFGAILLFIFGLSSFLASTKNNKIKTNLKSSRRSLFIRGFLFNLSNPSVIFFWISTVSLAVSQYGNYNLYISLYFGSTLLTVLFFDILKAYSAKKLSKNLTPESLSIISKISGAGIAGFGVFLLYDNFFR
jgi:threonine/homoserine/homoserine lactone efflux protein